MNSAPIPAPDLARDYGLSTSVLRPHPGGFEYALLARALRDMAARVLLETDRPGVETWGFRRIARLERDLEMFRPFCA